MLKKLLVAAACMLAAGGAIAQAYPSKPVRMIVGFPPGGGTDVVARVISQKLTEWWGQPVTVENRAGATGTIGADVVAKSPADGYTLIMGHVNSTGIAPNLFPKLPYDPIKDFTAVAYVGYVPNVLAVHPSINAKSVKELVALLKTQPGKLNYASSGNGSTQHLAGEMFKQLTGTSIVHVPYKGSGDAIKDLLAGVVAMNFDTMPPVMPHIQAGKLRPIAVSSSKRLEALPDVPTIAEAGQKGFDMGSWQAVFVPIGTPKPIVDRLHAEIMKIVATPDVQARLKGFGMTPSTMTPAELGEYQKAEVAKWSRVVKAAGIKAD